MCVSNNSPPTLQYSRDQLLELSNFKPVLKGKQFLKAIPKSILRHKPLRRKKKSKHTTYLNDTHQNQIPVILATGSREDKRPRCNAVDFNNLVLIPSVTYSDTFKFGLLNVRSARNKTSELCDYVTDHDFDIFVITESWFNSPDSVSVYELTPENYSAVLLNRECKRGGGIAVLHKKKNSSFRYSQSGFYKFRSTPDMY
ncbi:hypothetical protein SNE40_021153 [Patella caerulea]|uniref:Uncharacterized protein n=1 Tax=Patella caerulea TaxID=87958 RepID=A0AAN8IYV5_PATCE